MAHAEEAAAAVVLQAHTRGTVARRQAKKAHEPTAEPDGFARSIVGGESRVGGDPDARIEEWARAAAASVGQGAARERGRGAEREHVPAEGRSLVVDQSAAGRLIKRALGQAPAARADAKAGAKAGTAGAGAAGRSSSSSSPPPPLVVRRMAEHLYKHCHLQDGQMHTSDDFVRHFYETYPTGPSSQITHIKHVVILLRM